MRRLCLLVTLLVTGCASTGTNPRTVYLDTRTAGQPLPGATCQVSFGARTLTVLTPSTLPVSDAQGDLRVVCNKAGYRTSELYLRPLQTTGSNVGVGLGGGSGNVGLGIGMNFPLQMGRPDYPPSLTVEMQPQ